MTLDAQWYHDELKANTLRRSNGHRRCATCHRDREALRRAARTAA